MEALHTGRRRLVWAGALAAGLIGMLLCAVAGRTAAHALVIWLAVFFLTGSVYLADVFLPNRQSLRIRRRSAVLFLVTGAALTAFYLWHFDAAESVFVNDDALYYYQQLKLAEGMQAGLADTLRDVYASLRTDYPWIPNLFLAPLFSLTDRSSEGFGLAVMLMAWSPILYQLRRIALRLADQLDLPANRTLLLCGGTCLCVFTLPLLHRAALWRQVNLLGIPCLLQVVFLSWNADFRRREPMRRAALFLSAVLLVLIRRWFLFFLAGWLVPWGVMTLCRHLSHRDWAALRRFVLYAVLCAALGAVLLWPLLQRALGGNYTVAYAYWKKEGSALRYELMNQSWLLGHGTCALLGAGYLWGLLQRRSRSIRYLSAMMLLSGLFYILLFTRIQNMTFHQATPLMPAYVLGLMLFFAMLGGIRPVWLRGGMTAVACAALLVQWGVSVMQEKPQLVSPLLCHVSLRPPVREDLEQLNAVSDFISAHCDAAHPALILMNSADYDRLTFVTLRYPDLTMRACVALDRIALPSDGFPRAWFSARYILVPTVPQTGQPGGTVDKLTGYLLEDQAGRFETVATFAFDDFDLLVMQRRGAVRYDEVEELTALFAQEHLLYPRVYGDRIGYFYGLTLE
ncbi:MAG: hypothetical protein ACI4MG_01720 [Aristaeellaceae bacterium]